MAHGYSVPAAQSPVGARDARPEQAAGFRPAGEDLWEAYWEGLSGRHRLFREQSDEYARNLLADLEPGPSARVLDFGCGFGFVAARLAAQVAEIHVWDRSENMRRMAAVSVTGHGNARFVDLADRQDPGAGLRYDLILVNSVAQYMTPEEFSGWLVRWRKMLARGGRVVVSDLIPPDYRGTWDITALLKFSARRGFLLRALWQAMRELGGYYRMRRARPLTRYSRADLQQRAAAAGLVVEFMPRNLTHFTRRVTVVFSPAGSTEAE